PAEDEIGGLPVKRFALPLPRLEMRSLARAPFFTRSALAEPLRAAKAVRPDILHVPCFSANGAYAAFVAPRLRIPLVVTLQGETVMDDSNVYETSFTLRSSLRIALRRADAVTGCSQFVLDDAERRFGLRPGRGRVIPNAVELDEGVAESRVNLPF